MRILFLAHRFPYPPTFGSKVRAFNVIRHLAREHEVTVFAPVRSAAEEKEAAGIAPFCHAHRAFRVNTAAQIAKIGITLPSTVTASEAFFHSGEMQREVTRLVGEGSVDFVFAHCSAVGHYAEAVQGLPKLIDYCDVDSRKWFDYVAHKPWPLSLGYRWEARRMAAAERRVASRFDCVTVATPGEQQVLAEIGVRERVDWFPNGVDFDYFQPGTEAYDPNVISFVGRMDYFPNEQAMTDFCADVWPALRKARPALRLQIVGAAPTAKVLALGQLDGVSVTGSVPDVRPYVQRSALTIAPLKIARGTQNKILEAMAMAVPVVASRVAASGVDAVAGEHLLAADSPAELSDAILHLVDDRAARQQLAEAGQARVLAAHSWASAMTRLDGIVARCRAGAGGQ